MAILFQQTAFSADSYKYSCFYLTSSYGGTNVCPDQSYKFNSPEEASESVASVLKATFKAAWGADYYSFSNTYPECKLAGYPYYVYSCSFRYNQKRYASDGSLVESGFIEFGHFVAREHSCEDKTVLKGTVGAVIISGTDGKRWVASQNPGSSVCSDSCMYSAGVSQKCFLSIGSETEGFCNYNYSLILDANNKETRCQIDPSIKPGEIGDELSDKCPEGYEFANGSKMCTLIPCPEGSERVEGSETCTPIPEVPGGGTNPGGGDGGTNPGGGGGTNPGGGDGGTNPGGGDGGTNPGGGDGGTNPGGGDGGTDPGGGDGGTNPGGGDGGTNPGGGDGGTNPGGGDGDGDETFTPPGPLDLSASVAGRGAQVKTQIIDMKQKMVSSSTFVTAKSAFSGSSHAAAACPVGSVTLFTKQIVFDSHCKLFIQIAPLLKAVFIAIWSFIAVRVVLTA